MTIDLSNFDMCRILVVGDVMIDEYLWGEVDRISPEAPVQVVSVLRKSTTLGGAGNVANNLVTLGAKVSVASVIGAGESADSELLLKLFKDLSVDTTGLIQDPARSTTKKARIIAGHQHVLRIDHETRQEISQAHTARLVQFVRERIHTFNVVLISDYGKGLLTEILLRQVIDVARQNKKPIVVDPKGLDFKKYAGATAITPNNREASLAAGIEIADDMSLFAAGRRLLQDVPVQKVLMTCGKDGMVLFEQGQEPYRISTEARQVFDVSGAGDTVLAVLGLGLASGGSFRQAAALANVAAGIVVGKVGTATVSRNELQSALEPAVGGLAAKQKTLPDLIAIAEHLRAEGKTIVMTNGCFDLLHVGHIKLLSASKEMGDVLIVAIDDDKSVKALKGENRPIIRAQERLRIISALDCTDYVTLFSSEELENIIEAIRPDILTKGSDYTTETVLGRQIVERSGGRVVLVPVTEVTSSTRMINQIKDGGRGQAP
ncbi:MAG: bifunctional heptose 7-phosphate kinase/heptose 1-phosphate adenyltransferase [Desulfobacterales bacterium C00003060]|nr:MAG: bifunctional heptose 7-phosphate kinase/heptose 1-phosphate adenyltransferase [Desulfobacterales bacterium S3730MH5]OEU78298.1 MAG: bifunctional heptose 7-phosphate kinase/heptose 1-phosphate adenyltransferase [Desulfobacterales bacterium C00003060]